MMTFFRPRSAIAGAILLAASSVTAGAQAVDLRDVAYRQAVAEAVVSDRAIEGFYRQADFSPFWTGDSEQHRQRRAALIDALSAADTHGLPADRYPVGALRAQMEQAASIRDLAEIEAEMSRLFVRYARDLQTGLLKPSSLDDGLVRQVRRKPEIEYLNELAETDPRAYFKSLAPDSGQYRALRKQKIALEQLMVRGGWGETIPEGKFEEGDTGPAVIALRNRLVAMGYLKPTASPRYDEALRSAVQQFQSSHGLAPDGVAGKGTITELNRPVSDRLQSVIVALERERWLPRARGERHVLVNQTDFSAKIIDHGQVTFESRAVIGKNTHDRRSPEFSDKMEHMVINPSWYVPRSIITKEYLPMLMENPNAVDHLEITDRSGRQISRQAVDFTQFTPSSFPFAMRQPPGTKNALGLVKFMFPNKHNIYLHDTPQKSLFAREVRAFSHGCIRLADPFGFAYALLARQEENPKAFFHRILNTGRETTVPLKQSVPIHLIYRTAYIGPKGEAQYRRDVYGRDAKIWGALNKAGVALQGVQG